MEWTKRSVVETKLHLRNPRIERTSRCLRGFPLVNSHSVSLPSLSYIFSLRRSFLTFVYCYYWTFPKSLLPVCTPLIYSFCWKNRSTNYQCFSFDSLLTLTWSRCDVTDWDSLLLVANTYFELIVSKLLNTFFFVARYVLPGSDVELNYWQLRNSISWRWRPRHLAQPSFYPWRLMSEKLINSISSPSPLGRLHEEKEICPSVWLQKIGRIVRLALCLWESEERKVKDFFLSIVHNPISTERVRFQVYRKIKKGSYIPVTGDHYAWKIDGFWRNAGKQEMRTLSRALEKSAGRVSYFSPHFSNFRNISVKHQLK